MIDDEWIRKALGFLSESDSTCFAELDVTTVPILKFFLVDKYICPIIHNQINLGNNVLYNLLDFGNEFIEKMFTKEQIARNSLKVIDAYN